MYYEPELRFLHETFKKCRIQTLIADLSQPLDKAEDPGLYVSLIHGISPDTPLNQILPTVHPATIYRLQDVFGCRYMYLLLPELPREAIFAVGPYLTSAPDKKQIMQWAESRGISPARQTQLELYYSAIPILPENSQLPLMMDAFSERLWGPGGFSVEDINLDATAIHSIPEAAQADPEQDAMWKIRSMEQRYHYENELIDAVTKGQLHKAELLLSTFSTFNFEQRVADPLRNAKNYCIIMNTLLRKAAQQGGVHPVYLDSASSGYAAKIEQQHALDTIPSLMAEMFRGYCRLVRKHSLKDYSPPVQKALTYIDADISGNLSLSSISQALNISSSYLSTLFRKETGQTLTEYISQRRVKHAMHLLETTKLQVQTIAQHCGIMDVQYFSKVFKRITGKTPKEYRESQKR